MANRFQINQHRMAYGFIASRDGEYCLICKRGPGKVKLQIDHADNNPSNWEPDNLHLLCQTHNLQLRSVPVVFVDLSLEQARLLNIALNKISGSFDQELLARLLSELNEVPELDLTLSGFGEDELKELLKSLDAREKRERVETFDLEEAVKAAQSAPVAKQGDIWLLGDHRLVCDDSADGEAVQRLMGQPRAAMAFTDPPYNVDYGNHGGAPQRGRRTVANDNLGSEFEPFLEKACRNILDFTDGAVYICMSSSELHTLQKAFTSAGGHWSTFIIWATPVSIPRRNTERLLARSIADGMRVYGQKLRDYPDRSHFKRPLPNKSLFCYI